MSTNQNFATEIDDWSVYRRLVVDTLKRLDERTAELHNRQTQDGNRILQIEGRLADLKNVEDKLDKHSAELTNIKSERSTEKTIRRLLLVIGGGAWTIITVGISVWLKTVLG